MSNDIETTITAKTDKQYDEILDFIAKYTGSGLKIIHGKVFYVSGTEKIFLKKKKKIIIQGKNQENINEMKKHLEYILKSEKRIF